MPLPRVIFHVGPLLAFALVPLSVPGGSGKVVWWEQPGPCSAPGEGVGRAALCPAWHRVLALRGQAVNPTLCALCWS